LGLQDNLVELDTQGYTIIRGVLSEDQIERAQQALLNRMEKTTGKRVDIDTATSDDVQSSLGHSLEYIPYMLYDDEVFEGILMEEKPLALVSYLVGESCLLSSIGCHFKAPGPTGVVPLHADTLGPQPFPTYAQTANINYALTPYSREAGATALVPGSHKQARQPTPAESALIGEQSNPAAVPADLAPGDCVVWHGHTWHGSFERQIPGIRMNLAIYLARAHILTQERHKDVVPQEVLHRHANDERFKSLLAGRVAFGWQQEGYDIGKMGFIPTGWYD
jgi:ectoine hydroxylase-related dioxygenase (phytanoyl-CoA dioxygenase family)